MNIIDLKIRRLGKNRKFGQRLRERRRRKKKEERRKTSTRAFATRVKKLVIRDYFVGKLRFVAILTVAKLGFDCIAYDYRFFS